MSKRLSARSLDLVAQKWQALSERRRAHFLELNHSGRWKHYYREEQFLRRMRAAIRSSERWAEIAPPTLGDARPEQTVTEISRRTAA
jgi:hypothetical protein